jgi:hypothetical protein
MNKCKSNTKKSNKVERDILPSCWAAHLPTFCYLSNIPPLTNFKVQSFYSLLAPNKVLLILWVTALTDWAGSNFTEISVKNISNLKIKHKYISIIGASPFPQDFFWYKTTNTFLNLVMWQYQPFRMLLKTKGKWEPNILVSQNTLHSTRKTKFDSTWLFNFVKSGPQFSHLALARSLSSPQYW